VSVNFIVTLSTFSARDFDCFALQPKTNSAAPFFLWLDNGMSRLNRITTASGEIDVFALLIVRNISSPSAYLQFSRKDARAVSMHPGV